MNKIKKSSKKTKKYRVFAQMGSDLFCDVEAKSLEDVEFQLANGIIDGGDFTEYENSGWWEYGAIDEIK